MNTVYGVICDELGHATDGDAAWSTPSSAVRAVQNERIPIDYGHSHLPIGEMIYFERTAGNLLWGVGQVHDGSVIPSVTVKLGTEVRHLEHPLFWSPERIGDAEDGILFTGCSITPFPARVMAQPLTILEGALDCRSAADRFGLALRHPHEHGLLTRAAAAASDRRRTGGPLVVAGAQPHRNASGLELASASARFETRSAATLDVKPGLREVDLLIAPAEEPTQIFERGAAYVETYSFGCFSGAEDHPERVKLNRDHVISRTFGKALAIDPWSELGCVGTFKVAKTSDGDEALELLREDIAACSAGFEVPHGGDEWSGTNRRSRRIRHARLHHVAVTADPAHATRVLDVRGDEILTLH